MVLTERGPRCGSGPPSLADKTFNGGEDRTLRHVKALTPDEVPWSELPVLTAWEWSISVESIDVVVHAFGLDGAPNVDSLIKQLDINGRGPHPTSPLCGPFRNPGPPTWITSFAASSTTTDSRARE